MGKLQTPFFDFGVLFHVQSRWVLFGCLYGCYPDPLPFWNSLSLLHYVVSCSRAWHLLFELPKVALGGGGAGDTAFALSVWKCVYFQCVVWFDSEL